MNLNINIPDGFELSEDLMYLFNNGKNYQCYNLLGAHKKTVGEKEGFLFSVWAPNALSVSVVCDSNNWDRNVNKMFFFKNTGIWSCFIENIGFGEKYKFSIESRDKKIILKSDPFAYFSELRPATASVLQIPRAA